MAILFSAVTVTTEEEQAEFLVAGIPKNYADLEGWAEFDTLMSRMNTEQEIQVHASACLYGEGEVLDATPEEIAYFHHRVAMDDDFLYDHFVDETLCNSAYWKSIDRDYRVLLARLMPHAFPACTPAELGCATVDDAYAATQVLVWEIVQGMRDKDGRLLDTTLRDEYLYYTYTGNGHQSGDATPALAAYTTMETALLRHAVIPGFSVQTATLCWNAATGRYEATLTDQNGVLSQFSVTESGGLRTAIDCNTLTIWSEDYRTDTVKISLEKNLKTADETGMLAVLESKANGQTMILAGTVDDPVRAELSAVVKPAFGSVRVQKRDAVTKQPLAGAVFTLYDQGGNVVTTIGPTAADGTAQSGDVLYGSYILRETTPPEHYELDEDAVWPVVISEDTPTVSYTVDDPQQHGTLQVVKTAEDKFVEGVLFRLYGVSLYGESVDMTAETDQDGVATFAEVPVGSGYTVEEVNTAIRYVVSENQTVAIEWNKVTHQPFDNVLKKWSVTITKRDGETGTAQGDATLAGAKYGIYKGGQLIDTYVTDENGQFTTKYYLCDDDWNLREIEPSEGYLLDESAHHIGAEEKLYTAEYSHITLDVTETVEKGSIALIKHTDNGDTQLETPEAGAEFQVFLTSAGGYDNARKSERDYLVCDENGYAQTKKLPYGRYTVRQVKSWDGRELLPPFDVYIAENGRIYRYLANSSDFGAHVKIVKVDAETGKTIPYADAGFQLYAPDGSLITQRFSYPTPTTVDTFYTNDEGYLVTPEKLKRGEGYALVEVAAPYGYTKNSDPVYFDVLQSDSDNEDGVTVIRVEKQNAPQKGTITVHKTGEGFYSVSESNGVYQPVYADATLAGAVYEITAAEDIVTPDGTVRCAKGKVVDTVTTDHTGSATTVPLYLGSYAVREITAPYGYTQNGEPHVVTLTYAGQDVAVTNTATAFHNERQKAAIDLTKVLAQDERFCIGMNDEILAVRFGLFAAEDLTAADGSVIPADGLLEIVSCDENGYAAFDTDIPVGSKLYVQEIATDNHYVLSDTRYPVVFEYAGQDTALVIIHANDGKPIDNDLVYGKIQGLKIDRETAASVAGAVFGLFRADETAFTDDTAILTAESDADGVFVFENVPYGAWLIRELQPAEGFLPNDEVYPVIVSQNEAVIDITVVNDRIPEIGTTAAVDGEKEVAATEVVTLTDTVSYKHLIPGVEYTVQGVLMDKSTGAPLLIDGQEIRAEITFTPETSEGEVAVMFTFDAKCIKVDTAIVAFETLYREA